MGTPLALFVRIALLSLASIVYFALPSVAVTPARGDTLPQVPVPVAVDFTTPGLLQTESTLKCIGIKWYIDGDSDLDCRVRVEYRHADTISPWKLAQMLMRVEPGIWNDYGIDPGNLLAGSIFDLVPDTEYDLRLTLWDPDGGFTVKAAKVRTRALPADPPSPRSRFVVPGTGGGSGSSSDPFRGIASANAVAQPGDVFTLMPGTYTGVTSLTTSGTPTNPIVWRGQSVDAVILDGQGTAKPIIDLPGTSYVHLERMTLTRPKQMAVRASGTTGIVIRGCVIDVSQATPGYEMEGIYFLEPGDRNAFISENRIIGPFDWVLGRTSDGYGLVIGGTGHIIRCNEFSNWWDAIDVGKSNPSIVTEGCDIYQNEIYSCTDDGIETDGSRHNIRIFENRITNVLCGLSCQPIFGGPVYMLRNVVYNWQLKPLKFHEWPTGLVVLNNTFVGADPRGWGGGQWRNAFVRNNLFIGGSISGPRSEPIALETIAERADLDYNGWYQASLLRFAELNGQIYPTVEEFRADTGMETHGVLLDITSFLDAEAPLLGSYLGEFGYPPPYWPGDQDLRLRVNSPAVDAGAVLDNVSNRFHGLAPDLGAYEIGDAIPVYGPVAATAFVENDPIATQPGRTGLSAYPNPFSESTLIRTSLPRTSTAGVRVYDVGGRLVRRLSEAIEGPTAARSFSWDGRDEAGRRARPGVYYCRAEGAMPHASVTVVLLR